MSEIATCRQTSPPDAAIQICLLGRGCTVRPCCSRSFCWPHSNLTPPRDCSVVCPFVITGMSEWLLRTVLPCHAMPCHAMPWQLRFDLHHESFLPSELQGVISGRESCRNGHRHPPSSCKLLNQAARPAGRRQVTLSCRCRCRCPGAPLYCSAQTRHRSCVACAHVCGGGAGACVSLLDIEVVQLIDNLPACPSVNNAARCRLAMSS